MRSNSERLAGPSSAQVRAIDLRAKEFRPLKSGTVLLENSSSEIASFRMSKGEERPVHRVSGEAVLYCVEGYARLRVKKDTNYDLTPGVLVCLAANEPHQLSAIEDVTLLSIQLGRTGQHDLAENRDESGVPQKDIVQEASEESFPASDPPSWTTGVEETSSRLTTNFSTAKAPALHSLEQQQLRQSDEDDSFVSDRTKEDRAHVDGVTAQEEIAELMPDEAPLVAEGNHEETGHEETDDAKSE